MNIYLKDVVDRCQLETDVISKTKNKRRRRITVDPVVVDFGRSRRSH